MVFATLETPHTNALIRKNTLFSITQALGGPLIRVSPLHHRGREYIASFKKSSPTLAMWKLSRYA